MTSYRKRHEYWTEAVRVVDGKVKVTTCCCAAPAAHPHECATVQGNKTPCRCDCHRPITRKSIFKRKPNGK